VGEGGGRREEQQQQQQESGTLQTSDLLPKKGTFSGPDTIRKALDLIEKMSEEEERGGDERGRRTTEISYLPLEIVQGHSELL